MKILSTLFLSTSGSVPQAFAFLVPPSATVGRPLSREPLHSARRSHDDGAIRAAADEVYVLQRRRDFLTRSLGASALLSTSSFATLFPSIARADQAVTPGDLTSQLFNSDGSLRDPNTVVEAKDRTLSVPFSIPSASEGIRIDVATDGTQRISSGTADAATTLNLNVSYKLPVKWNQNATSALPLYYDSSEGKNGISCDRITVYAISKPANMDVSVLEKASRLGVATSLFMDQLPNKYFDQGVSKADLIGGRTVRKPIKSVDAEGGIEIDEQVYYEFDLAFAPTECPDFGQGNEENLGLGFCPYDRIFLVSATVLPDAPPGRGGTLLCCVLECDKKEWKMGNSDLKRVRSSFTVDR